LHSRFSVICAARVNQIEFGICARGSRVFIDRRRSSLNYFSQCSNIGTLANCFYNVISVFKNRRSILHEFLNFYYFSKFSTAVQWKKKSCRHISREQKCFFCRNVTRNNRLLVSDLLYKEIKIYGVKS